MTLWYTLLTWGYSRPSGTPHPFLRLDVPWSLSRTSSESTSYLELLDFFLAYSLSFIVFPAIWRYTRFSVCPKMMGTTPKSTGRWYLNWRSKPTPISKEQKLEMVISKEKPWNTTPVSQFKKHIHWAFRLNSLKEILPLPRIPSRAFEPIHHCQRPASVLRRSGALGWVKVWPNWVWVKTSEMVWITWVKKTHVNSRFEQNSFILRAPM